MSMRRCSALFGLSGLFGAACGGARGAAPAVQPAVGGEAAPAPVPIPPGPLATRALLVATGLGNAREGLSLADAAREYCAGQIAALEPVRAFADARLGCRGRAIAGIADFLPEAGSALVIVDLAQITPQLRALPVDGVSFFERPEAYPLVLPGEGGARPDFKPHLTHYIMTGVTAITRATGAECDRRGGSGWLTENLRPHFAGADYVHISNEVSLKPDCEYPAKGTFTFCSKERDLEALVDLGANVVELTGNHNRDFGDEPFRRTFEWYQRRGMKTFGGGLSPEGAAEPLIVPLAGDKRLGLLGFNEACPLKECARKPGEVGANPYDTERAKAAIAKLRGAADFVMVSVQFKEWDSAEPTPAQTRITRELIDAGADLVYGSQAHQLQKIEFYRGKPIFHGLGNLLFDQIHRIGVRQAFFVHHYFFEGRLVQSVPVFTYMSDERQPTIATPEQAAEMQAIAFDPALLYPRPEP
ncbi:MAG TPA: CapA family protein [Kofleriaceae bacterium]|nr:CapA family protein [Kofleriaceae bacterium]